MKNLNLVLLLCATLLLTLTSCSDPCNTIICENGGSCLDGTCDCPDGTIGINCESFDLSRVQSLLDEGKTPQELFYGNVPLDSLYGKIYECGYIFYLDTLEGTGKVAAAFDADDLYSWGGALAFCDDLVLGNKDDWFLPSRDDLYTIFDNLHSNGYGNFSSAKYYWSSMEANYGTSWLVEFWSGYSGAIDQADLNSVRPVRAF